MTDGSSTTALGVMLLEIGLWERVVDLDRGALLSPTLAADPEAVRQRLAKHGKRRLAFYAGSKYADFVLFCLDNDLSGGGTADQSMHERFSNGIADFCSLAQEL